MLSSPWKKSTMVRRRGFTKYPRTDTYYKHTHTHTTSSSSSCLLLSSLKRANDQGAAETAKTAAKEEEEVAKEKRQTRKYWFVRLYDKTGIFRLHKN